MRRTIAIACLTAIILGLNSCSHFSTERLAGSNPVYDVTIHRDEWGVPHIIGNTDAAAAYGMGWAQAEDNFPQLEENFWRASGRAAELLGDAYIFDDWLNRSLEIERWSRAEHDSSSPELQALVVAYIAALNSYAAEHPEDVTRPMEFEPWQVHAFIRYLYYQRGFVYASSLTADDLRAGMNWLNPLPLAGLAEPEQRQRGEGSNSWAVVPDRTEEGAALLFINPHLPWFGPSQVYEAHLLSDDGWNFTGYSRFGFPLPYVGFGESLGWASTDNYADLSDAYRLTLTNHGQSYTYGSEVRALTLRDETINIATDSGTMRQQTLTLARSHHGPVVGFVDGSPVAIRMAKFEDSGWLAEWYAMTRADNLDSFRDAVGALDMLFGNYLYADQSGNIFYVYNGAVPIRDERFDWGGIVDGSNPATEWQGYHSIDDLPQLLNPPSGDIQNSNGTPFLSTSVGNPNPADFPSYMVTEGDNPRHRRSRDIMASRALFSFEDWSDLAFDLHVEQAQHDLPVLFEVFDAANVTDPDVVAAMAVLRDWDLQASTDSVAMSVYASWSELWARADRDTNAVLPTFETALDWFADNHGGWTIEWGDINRLQRPTGHGDPAFDSALPSLPVGGAPSFLGAMMTNWTSVGARVDGVGYPRGGHSYVASIQFGERVEAGSLHALGASSRSNSPHYFDQAHLLSEGRFKPAWLYREDVLANAVQSYRPGESRQGD